MSEFVISLPMQANGTIGLASIVAQDTTVGNDRYVLQAGVGSDLFGIVQRGANVLPVNGGSTPVAAVAGDPVYIYPPGSTAILTAGTAGWAYGDYITSDANGNGVTAGPGQKIVAKSLSAAVSGGQYEVEALQPGSVCPPIGAGLGAAVTTAVSLTLTPANSKQTITVSAVDKVITLPTVVGNAGFSVRIIYTGASAGGTTGTIVTQATADAATALMIGHMITTPAVTKGIVNTAASSIKGDAADFITDGTNWYVVSFTGTWTRQA